MIPPVAIDAPVLAALRAGAVVVFNLSGGKDSTAAAHAVSAMLDTIGHPKELRAAVHADLGRAEWRSTAATVERIAAGLDLPLILARREAGDLVARWEGRWAAARGRYAELETYHLIGPWSSASKRFCTSEAKVAPIKTAVRRAFPGRPVLQVIGLRRSESRRRAATPVSKPTAGASRTVADALAWHPIVNWSERDVFAYHDRHGLELHEAYRTFGSTRLSCAFCVLASLNDLTAATRCLDNAELYRHLVALEATSHFSFQPGRWLGDVALNLLGGGLVRDLSAAKVLATRRRRIEAAMPPGLRYVQGWPPRIPTRAEAEEIEAARSVILADQGLDSPYVRVDRILARFEELIAAKHAKATTAARPASGGKGTAARAQSPERPHANRPQPALA